MLALAAAACSGAPEERGPPDSFPPLTYEYLTPIRLNVAAIEVEQRFVPGQEAAALVALDPAPPAQAIARMAADRLQALGPSGRAVLAVNDASIVRRGDAYEGALAIELDIYTSANVRTAFAEAQVSGRRTINEGESTRKALYELTKQLMDQLNVEFEFQVRRSLRDWLVEAPASVPAPVEQQPLAAPAL